MNKQLIKFIKTSKKELILFACALIFVFTAMNLSSRFLINTEQTETVAVTAEPKIIYRLFINDQDIGIVESMEAGELLVSQALESVVSELGYDEEFSPKIRIYEEQIDGDIIPDFNENLVEVTKETIIAGLDSVKVKAYAMKIGDEFVVALKSKEEVKEVLANAQSLYVSEDTSFEIQLTTDPHNSIIEVPRVLLKEATDDDREFLTSSIDGTLTPTATVESTAEAAKDPRYDGKTVGIEFSQDVIVFEGYIAEDKLSTVEVATELITKENQEPQIYSVKSGDCISTIASDHDMSTSALYTLNEGLKSKKYLQIGDELVVMVPEPELSVATKEEVVYARDIQQEIVKKENKDKFQGYEKTVDNGSNGEMRVTAILTKMNGKEVDRKIIDEVVLREPTPRIVEVGVKPLPASGSTGKYIRPVESYVLTSGFGYRWGRLHAGVDMANDTGTPIRATDGGRVSYAGWMSGYGYVIFIDHENGVQSRYAHLSKILVSKGQSVSQYEKIGLMGSTGRSTGPHLHFEIRFDGVPANPMNYLSY